MVQRVYRLGLRRFEVVAEVPVNVLWTDDYLSLCIVLGRSIPTAICTESWHDVGFRVFRVLGPRLALDPEVVCATHSLP